VFNVGPLELIVVLIIALIVLGPQRLPDVARSVGRGMREFRTALENPDDDEDDDDDDEEDDDRPDGDDPDETDDEAAADYQNEADSSESSSSWSERV
jgi:TatA/E family protein of Tat protein translocase